MSLKPSDIRKAHELYGVDEYCLKLFLKVVKYVFDTASTE